VIDRYVRTALVLAVAGVAIFRTAAAQDQIGLPLGATPEAAEIEDLEGNAVDLGPYIGGGKPVVLEFWATWCNNCEELEPQLLAASRKYKDEVEFLVVAVAVNQSLRRVRRYSDEHEMPGRVLWDSKGRAVRAFMAPSTSYIVVLDAAGIVAYTGVGPEQDIDAAIQKAIP
jgi:thiol-disulfide isomerase/thioredoxin